MSKLKVFLGALGLVLSSVALSANPPPVIPQNACEAGCIQEYRFCQRTCRNTICLIPCEDVFEACLVRECTTG